MKSILQRVSIVIFALTISLLSLELLIRIGGYYDLAGQFYFMDRPLRPYTVSETVITAIKRFGGDSTSSIIIYDKNLGWRMRPYSETPHVTINSGGIRSHREFELTPSPNIIRIALFGDSFTFGAEVNYEETWAYQLEQHLLTNGIQAEILNFGVSAYGMDQAYLMWQHYGAQYNPDIVIFGFQPENIHRNLNIFRPLKSIRGDFPLSKPRFILKDGSLELVNSPTISVEDLIPTYQNLHESTLIKYEDYYDPYYQWWMESKLLAFVYEVISRNANINRPLTPDSERIQLTTAILDNFGTEVELSGGQFMIAHLHNRGSLQRHIDNLPIAYYYILDMLEAHYPILSFEDALGSPQDAYWQPNGHYSPVVTKIIATEIGIYLEKCLSDRSCLSTRFLEQEKLQFYID